MTELPGSLKIAPAIENVYKVLEARENSVPRPSGAARRISGSSASCVAKQTSSRRASPMKSTDQPGAALSVAPTLGKVLEIPPNAESASVVFKWYCQSPSDRLRIRDNQKTGWGVTA